MSDDGVERLRADGERLARKAFPRLRRSNFELKILAGCSAPRRNPAAVLVTAGVTREMCVCARAQTGHEKMLDGDSAGAVERYTQALIAAPTGPLAHVLLADRAAAYTKLDKHTDAFADAL